MLLAAILHSTYKCKTSLLNSHSLILLCGEHGLARVMDLSRSLCQVLKVRDHPGSPGQDVRYGGKVLPNDELKDGP